MEPIILQVPERFRYGSSKGNSRNWGLNILTYCPSFTSPDDPENPKFGANCAGICNGRILIAVENQVRALSRLGLPNMGDFIARNTMRWLKTPPYPQNVQVHDLRGSDRFDEAFERVTTVPSDATNSSSSHFAEVQKFYFRRAENVSHYDLAATCNARAERTTCILHFSLLCDAGISISVNGLDEQYLKFSGDIKEKVDRFISGMVRTPPCIH
jgi:hypothetical protein